MSYLGRSSEFGVRSRYIYTASGSETSISGADDNNNSLSFTDGAYVDVYLNGVLLVPNTDYNTTTANTIGGLSALAASDVVEIVVYDAFNVADTVPASTGGTFNGNVTANAFYGDGSNLTGLAASFDQLTDTTVSTSDPTISSNPSATGHLWLNKISGEVYVCTDATAGANVWTNIGEGTGSIIPNYSASYLVVAGGGGGCSGTAGGGGAGGFLTSSATLTIGESYTITVGAGGAATSGESDVNADNGENSILSGNGISTITAIGGGGGSAESSGGGSDGGSGGGGGGGTSGDPGGSGTSGQGFAGGDGSSSGGGYGSGGGGGASEVGSNGGGSNGGNGGDGSISTLISSSNATTASVGEVSGSDVYFAGGGGGSTRSGTQGVGGLGGGTDGVGNSGTATNAPANTGAGGGGAAESGNGGNGGSGVVILRIATSNYSGTTTGSPTVFTEGSDTVLVYKSSGSYTA